VVVPGKVLEREAALLQLDDRLRARTQLQSGAAGKQLRASMIELSGL